MADPQHSLADVPPIGLDTLDRLLKIRHRVSQELERDAHRAARGERLALLIAGKPVADVWLKDLLPMIEHQYDKADEDLMPGHLEKDALIGYRQALKDLVELVTGSVQLGRGAMRRIATRKLEKVQWPPTG